MSKYTRFQMGQTAVAFLAIGMIFGLMAGSFPSGWTTSNQMRIGSLFGAIIVIAGLLWALNRGYKKTKASPAGKGRGAFVFTLVAFMATFTSVAIAMDLAPTAWIRAMPGFWSQLPSGNLFVAGGRAGWTYVSLVAILLLAVAAQKLWGGLMVYLGFRLATAKKAPIEPEAKPEGPPDAPPKSWSIREDELVH